MGTAREKIIPTCPPEDSLYGKKGWVEVLRREYFSDILDKTSQAESYRRFHGLNGNKAAKLLAVLPEKAGQDRQNFAPVLKDLLQMAARHPARVFLSGYLIDSGRWDERITVDTLIYLDEYGLMAPIEEFGADGLQINEQYRQIFPMLHEDFPFALLLHYYRQRNYEIKYSQKLEVNG